jgi:hypothetical protein
MSVETVVVLTPKDAQIQWRAIMIWKRTVTTAHACFLMNVAIVVVPTQKAVLTQPPATLTLRQTVMTVRVCTGMIVVTAEERKSRDVPILKLVITMI